MSAVRIALLQMTIARLLALLATVAGFAVLGRLLDPETFGYFAIAFTIYNLLKVLANFGLRQFIIRSEEELPPATLAAATGLSFLISAGCCLACVSVAAFLRGGLVPAPIADALVPLGVALLVGPVALAAEAQFHRGLVFRVPARAAVVSTVAEVAVALALALAGFGVVALATGTLAAQVALAAVLLAGAGPSGRIWPAFRLRGLKLAGAFGGRLTAINVLPNGAEIMLVSGLGALAGPAATGLFNRASVIRDILDRTLLEGIAPVILPAVSTALRDGMRPEAIVATKLDYLAVLCWPAFALIALLAEPLVTVLLGPGWSDAVPAVQLLAIGGLTLPITKMSLKLFTAIDALDTYLRIETAYQLLRLALGLAGAFLSLEAFCAGMSIALVVKAWWIQRWLARRFGVAEPEHRNAVRRGVLVTAAALAMPAALAFSHLAAVWLLAASLAGGGAGWMLGIVLLRHPLISSLQELLAVRRTARGEMFN